jgi:hypothetical protein
MSVRFGAALARRRLEGARVLMIAALALLAVAGMALLERVAGRTGAADRALLAGTFGLVLPLFCYFAVARALGQGSLNTGTFAMARHGALRPTLIAGVLLPAGLVCAVLGVTAAALAVTIARGLSDGAWLEDTATSAWVGGSGGLAYALAFMGASTFGARGRLMLLLLDWVLGAGSSLLSAPWPRAHLRNLAGGAPVLELSQTTSLALLFGTSFAFFWLGLMRTPR